MKISLNWLKQYIDTNLEPQEIARILTDTGLEVEGIEKIETIQGGLEGVVIGEVKSKEKHPDADRLNVTTVDIGTGELLQIVCGAPNVATGQKVVVATVGCTLFPEPDKAFKIKKSKIRGVESFGMICAEDELGLGDDHDGIMVLDENAVIGTPAKQFFNVESDYLIEIGLTPNRSDAMGHIGVARDLKAFLNFHNKANINLNVPHPIQAKSNSNGINITVEDYDACPRYAGAVLTNIKIAPSPSWLQNRLLSIGLKPINNIVDITNFVMFETGNPLHAFDLSVVNGNVIVRKARKGEKLVTLDEVERELNTEDLMICNENGAMCIGGVYGGLHSGVQENTNAIFLEAAYFNPVTVRKTAKRHGLSTDSSFRFERGVDPNNVINAMNRAISLIVEITGAELGQTYDLYPTEIEQQKVQFKCDRIRSLIGVDITDDQICSILKELDIQTEKKGELIEASIPTYRVDVTREADIAEEVLRIYGFNNVPIPAKLNSSITPRANDNNEVIYNLIADLLANRGFYEIMNNSLSSSSIWDQIKTTSFSPDKDVKILNPLSNELDVMRQTLLFGGLKSIEHNQNRQHADLKFFEFGNDYRFNADKELKYPQRKKLGIWVTGNKTAENWTNAQVEADFFYLKGIVEAILTKLGIFKNPMISSSLNDLYEDGINYAIAKKSVVDVGWIRKDVLKAFGIKKPVFYANFDWQVIEDICVINNVKAKAIPKTHYVRRDFSLLLDKKVTFLEINALSKEVDNKILRKVGLFDVYEGKNLPADKKSYAVKFIFQDDEKTLKDQQVDAIMDKIRNKLETALGAELR
ncbi:phenylalanine--tRNA ligase subunit beta [Paracrocinitomix mangrovi]|uniref:phenylalanine--tRNA ligase subunit beta n=1 Tax=Paracrocinitomix mangrovi TaxID=2862509 RepID=UPI001C8D3A56|nr:phenylalanine--tRNA ligase subunit beta [Paracrocinitomix mangrovi]UKN01723.1 phenylalanine--tRNA ligase subunit beta [Paracrocinitomix mangrovi]